MYFPQEFTTDSVIQDSVIDNLSNVVCVPHQDWQVQNAPTDQEEDQLHSNSAEAQETDNEALSSLLMLSKSNAEQPMKIFSQETAMNDYNRTLVQPKITHLPPSHQVQQMRRSIAPPTTERSMRGESNQPLSKTVKIEDLRKFFHLPIVEVARQLGTCTTALKKICRKNKISKWPYRQIRSITKSIQSLEMASLNDTLNEELRMQYREQIVTLQNAIDDLIRDPNKVVTLVNMGLSEDLAKIGDRPVSAALISGTSAHMPGGMGSVGGGGLLSMMPWPKPSADVQQIMLAAAAMTTQSADGGSSTVTSAAAAKSQRLSQKRKLNALASAAADSSAGASDSHGGYRHDEYGNAQKRQATVGTDAIIAGTNMDGGDAAGGNSNFGSSSLIPASSSSGDANGGSNYYGGQQSSGISSSSARGGAGGVQQYDGSSSAGEDNEDGENDSQINGTGAAGDDTVAADNNLRNKMVDIGLTVVQCDMVGGENQRMQFSGPVQLAPLQRKKLRPNITRKVVPLMEPDIGSNFGIEFVPQFILNILHKTLADKSLADSRDVETRLLVDGAMQGIMNDVAVTAGTMSGQPGSVMAALPLRDGATGLVPGNRLPQIGSGSVPSALSSGKGLVPSGGGESVSISTYSVNGPFPAVGSELHEAFSSLEQ